MVSDGFPLYNNQKRLIVKLTNRCNLDCAYCYEIKGDVAGDITAIYRSIIQADKEQGINVIILHGGEPLLWGWRNILQLKKSVDVSVGHNILWGVQTNGTLLTKEIIDRLIDGGLHISVSIDSILDITGNYRSSTASQLNVLDLILKAQGNVSILTVVNNRIVRYAADIYGKLRDYDVDIRFLLPKSGRNGFADHRPSPEQLFAFYKELLNLYFRDTSTKMSIIDVDEDVLGLACGVPVTCKYRNNCQVESLCLDVYGKQTTCDFFEHGVQKVQLPNDCETCKFVSMCNNGCPGLRENGRFVYCSFRKSYLEYLQIKVREVANVGEAKSGASGWV